jgi:RNA polymerase sigma-70 factor, ECF subfamily
MFSHEPMLRLLKRVTALQPGTDDEVLVRHAQEGHPDAFRVLFERHVSSIRRFLRDLLRDTTAADDATQEVFARVHAQLARLGSSDRFRPYIFGIARNVAFESKRLKSHEVFDEEAVPDAVLPSPDPEGLLLDRELEKCFSEALGQLSPHRRAALALRLDHGLPYEEIAAAMGWSVPTVKNEIHRARLKLRAAMAPHLGDAS